MKKRLGIDIDGTVTRPETILPYMNKDFGLSLSLEDIVDYDLSLLVDIPASEFAQWWLNIEAKVYEESPLAEHVKDVLLEWEKLHELYFISARSTHLLAITENWFKKEGLPFHHIELTDSHNKVELIKNYQLDLFIEDKHDNAVIVHQECKIPVLLFDTPYNQQPLPQGVIRIYHWFEAKAWVKRWVQQG